MQSWVHGLNAVFFFVENDSLFPGNLILLHVMAMCTSTVPPSFIRIPCQCCIHCKVCCHIRYAKKTKQKNNKNLWSPFINTLLYPLNYNVTHFEFFSQPFLVVCCFCMEVTDVCTYQSTISFVYLRLISLWAVVMNFDECWKEWRMTAKAVLVRDESGNPPVSSQMMIFDFVSCFFFQYGRFRGDNQ